MVTLQLNIKHVVTAAKTKSQFDPVSVSVVCPQVVKLSEIVSLAKEAQVDITFQLPI